MDWNAIGVSISVMVTVMVPLFTLHGYVMKLMIRNEINEHDERIKKWINGSFLRAGEAQTRMNSMEARIENLEDAG